MSITYQEAEMLETKFADALEDTHSIHDAARAAWEAWQMLWQFMERENNYSNNLGSEILDWQIGNWANDCYDLLHNARKHEEVIKINEQILQITWLNDKSNLFHENAKRSIAHEYADMGQVTKALELYEEYLKEDPLWGWAWIGYWRVLQNENEPKYEQTLHDVYQQIMNGTPFRDMEDMCRELGDEFKTLGLSEESSTCYDKEKKFTGRQSTMPIAPRTEVKPAKIYPNDPCPCGSGKKYKKCCGK